MLNGRGRVEIPSSDERRDSRSRPLQSSSANAQQVMVDVLKLVAAVLLFVGLMHHMLY